MNTTFHLYNINFITFQLLRVHTESLIDIFYLHISTTRMIICYIQLSALRYCVTQQNVTIILQEDDDLRVETYWIYVLS